MSPGPDDPPGRARTRAAGMTPVEQAHLAALASLPEVGPSRLIGLLRLGAPTVVWSWLSRGRAPARGAPGLQVPPGHAVPSLPRAVGITDDLLSRWRRHAREPWPEIMAGRLESLGLQVLSGPGLPPRLADDLQPPGALFVLGSQEPLGAGGVLGADEPDRVPMVGVVGTRRASQYGLRIAEELGQGLSLAGAGVVSGLALGIDAAAHRGAVSAGGAPTVGVLGASHDRPCPMRNRRLAREVADMGCLLSEVPPGIESAPWRYPARNRIIAALCDVVVVVESRVAGGSMITVDAALDRGRAVMAVPGAVDRPTSEGCHSLLRDGAHLCAGVDDVLGLLGLLGAGTGRSVDVVSRPDDPLAARILDDLSEGALPIEALAAATGAGLAELSAAVGSLEEQGFARRVGGRVERIARNLADGGVPLTHRAR